MNSFVPSLRLLEWSKRAHYSFTAATSKTPAVLWSAGGEERYFISETDGKYGVTNSSRSGGESFLFTCAAPFVVERYFWGFLGGVIRSRLQLPRLRVPTTESAIAPGYRIEGPADKRFTLVDAEGVSLMTALDDVSDMALLVKTSYWLTWSVTDIETSYLDPEGRPLFKDGLPREREN
jgi:hypothetical protein